MKKYIIQLILLFWVSIAFTQNKISSYQYWFDNDYANRITSPVTPVKNLNLNTNIATTGLTDGLHTCHIRFKDNAGLWSSALSQFFYKLPPSAIIDRKIVLYEYWFDGNYAGKISTSVTSTDNLNLNKLIPSAGLNFGLHTCHIRFKDNTGLWSSTLSQFFYKLPPASITDRKLAQYEYWFDNDYANKSAISLAGSDNLNMNTLIPASGLNDGLHTFHIRFKDTSGLWSSALSQFFYKVAPESAFQSKLVQYEYWFDDNYAGKTVSSVPGNENLNLNAIIPSGTLPDGMHSYNIRFKDSSGLWSSTISQFIYKVPEQDFTDNKISGYRFWIDDNFAQALEQNLTIPAKNHILINDFDLSQVNKGIHEIHFQFKDLAGKWSSVTTDSIEKLSLPIASFDYSDNSDCVSPLYTFANKSIDGDLFHWDFGDGSVDSTSGPAHAYLTPGNYTVSLSIKDTTTLKENSSQIQISVHGNTYSSIVETACNSYTSPSNLYKWTNSAVYSDTIPNYMSCDSIITINLTVKKVDVSVTQKSNLLKANAATAAYQWLDCNNNSIPVSDEVNQSFTALSNGDYAVEITQDNCIDTSACISVTSVNIIGNTFGGDFRVYPNPTKDIVFIDLGSSFLNVKVELADLKGSIIKQVIFKDKRTLEINIEEPAGIYILTVESDNKKASARIIKN